MPLRTVSQVQALQSVVIETNAALEEVRVNMAEMKAENKPVISDKRRTVCRNMHTRLDEYVWGVGLYNASRLLHRAT
jgi:hypothetical protein